jgi:beta-glucosidase
LQDSIIEPIEDTLAFYDENMDFVVEPGKVEILVGASNNDIRKRTSF